MAAQHRANSERSNSPLYYMSTTDAEVGILLLVPSKGIVDAKKASAVTMATQLEDERYFIIIRGGSKPEYMNQ